MANKHWLTAPAATNRRLFMLTAGLIPLLLLAWWVGTPPLLLVFCMWFATMPVVWLALAVGIKPRGDTLLKHPPSPDG